MAAQLIAVVRHGHAGDRGAWTANDDLRPLSHRGCAQADQLVAHLGIRPAAVLSSPSLRCLATVLPLTRAHQLPLTTVEELYEGGSGATALRRLAAGAATVVGCTHGDVVDDLLRLLSATGVSLPVVRTEKGSTWLLELVDGLTRSARYLPPPA